MTLRTHTYTVCQQVEPPTSRPFFIIERFTTLEGTRSRIQSGQYATHAEAVAFLVGEGAWSAVPGDAQIPAADGQVETDPAPVAFDWASASPWPVAGENNGFREGWKGYFTGRTREACPFPPARHDLLLAYQIGWDKAAEEDAKFSLGKQIATASAEPCKGCGNVAPIGSEFFSCCPDGPRRSEPKPHASRIQFISKHSAERAKFTLLDASPAGSFIEFEQPDEVSLKAKVQRAQYANGGHYKIVTMTNGNARVARD